jgi:hypothetical protein
MSDIGAVTGEQTSTRAPWESQSPMRMASPVSACTAEVIEISASTSGLPAQIQIPGVLPATFLPASPSAQDIASAFGRRSGQEAPCRSTLKPAEHGETAPVGSYSSPG